MRDEVFKRQTDTFRNMFKGARFREISVDEYFDHVEAATAERDALRKERDPLLTSKELLLEAAKASYEDNNALKAEVERLRGLAERAALHWEIIKGQCTDGDGFTERSALNLDTAFEALLKGETDNGK